VTTSVAPAIASSMAGYQLCSIAYSPSRKATISPVATSRPAFRETLEFRSDISTRTSTSPLSRTTPVVPSEDGPFTTITSVYDGVRSVRASRHDSNRSRSFSVETTTESSISPDRGS